MPDTLGSTSVCYLTIILVRDTNHFHFLSSFQIVGNDFDYLRHNSRCLFSSIMSHLVDESVAEEGEEVLVEEEFMDLSDADKVMLEQRLWRSALNSKPAQTSPLNLIRPGPSRGNSFSPGGVTTHTARGFLYGTCLLYTSPSPRD